MKRVRFSLRMLFVAVAVIGAVLGWITSQLNWIRQRHQLLEHCEANKVVWEERKAVCPWQLRLFGEEACQDVCVPKEQLDEARRLFPEAVIFEADSPL